MKHYIQIECPYCESEDLVKNGHSENGTQRYRCKTCRRSFQWEYTYRAWLPEVKQQIEEQTLNSSGVRDISRNLGIAKNTVIATLRTWTPQEINHAYAEYLAASGAPGLRIDIRVEADEFWSFVRKKATQRWTWYALDRATGTILAHHTGRRTDAACDALMKKLACFPIVAYYTDDWQSYHKFIPAHQHYIGKDQTWKIERRNLNFRTHIKRLHRKTICFSKDETIHDNVIGRYIERHYYQQTCYEKVA